MTDIRNTKIVYREDCGEVVSEVARWVEQFRRLAYVIKSNPLLSGMQEDEHLAILEGIRERTFPSILDSDEMRAMFKEADIQGVDPNYDIDVFDLV